jgi:hypothetical protein
MGAEDIVVVDTLSLADFHRTLQARLDEAYAVLARLDPVVVGATGATPALGGFEDAQRAGERHQRLREEYLARLRRLIAALTAAHAATATIIAKYQSVEALNTANLSEILSLIGDGLEHEQDHGYFRGR